MCFNYIRWYVQSKNKKLMNLKNQFFAETIKITSKIIIHTYDCRKRWTTYLLCNNNDTFLNGLLQSQNKTAWLLRKKTSSNRGKVTRNIFLLKMRIISMSKDFNFLTFLRVLFPFLEFMRYIFPDESERIRTCRLQLGNTTLFVIHTVP